MNWNDLTMAQKSELMRVYIRNGVTSLDAMSKHFNTYANGGPKKPFSEWSNAMKAKYPWLELDSQKAGYDYNRYYDENYDDAWKRLEEEEARHFTDRYKLPNHLTFSNESIYSQGPSYGGEWTKDDRFIPSVINKQQHPTVYKEYRPYTEDEIYSKKFATGGNTQPDNPPFVLPVNSEGLPYYTLPELEVVAERLPQAKATDANIQKYANAIANGQLRLTQIPNTELRNRVRAVPIMNQWYKDMNRNGTIAAVGLASALAAPYAIEGAILAIPEVASTIANVAEKAGSSNLGQRIYKGMSAMVPGSAEWWQLPNWLKVGTAAADMGFTAKNASDLVANPNMENAINTGLGLTPYIVGSPQVIKEAKNIKNSFSFKRPDKNPNNFYRVVFGREAIDDAINSGVIKGTKKYFGQPYFGKGKVPFNEPSDVGVISGKPYIIEGDPSKIDFIDALAYNDLYYPKGYGEHALGDMYSSGRVVGKVTDPNPNKVLDNFVSYTPENHGGIRLLNDKNGYTNSIYKELNGKWEDYIQGFPYYNQSVNPPSYLFNYWEKLPIGWIRHSFATGGLIDPPQIFGTHKYKKGGKKR